MNEVRKKAFVNVIAIIVLAAILFFGNRVFHLQTQLSKIEESLTKTLVDAVKKSVSTPGGIKAPSESSSVYLTRAGIIKWTNVQRAQVSSLPLLLENSTLDSIADVRAKDMFAKQYFAHVSPSGDSVSKEADGVGYDYIAIGENIALGNFEGDKALVQAWMDSPGHRANILNTRYKEIGVAARKGIYEGRTTWIGVQVFGLPASVCPRPDAALKEKIDSEEVQITNLGNTANILRQELENAHPQTEEERKQYNEKADQYNALVSQINSLVVEVKGLISRYNSQVQALNSCIAG